MKKLERFIPQTPDPYLKQADQLGAVKFGHINALVDAINSTIYGDYLQLEGDGPMSTTLRALEDPEGNKAKLFLATDQTKIEGLLTITDTLSIEGRLELKADPTATTQTTAVIQATDTNSGIAIVPNGTGAFTLDVPDGTATGGNARGDYAVDLQRVRLYSNRIARGLYSFVVGYNNWANGSYGVAMGVGNRISSSSWSIGNGNSDFGTGGGITLGSNNYQNTSSYRSVISGGFGNNINNQYCTISGGQSNTASTNTHATVVGGYQNSSTGQYSVSGGYSNVASGQGAVALGYDNTATDNYAIAFGHQNNATGNGYSAMAFGRFNQSTSRRTIAIGQSNTASDENAISLGLNNQATKRTTIAVGDGNNASNNGAIAIGNSNTASGLNSFAMGVNNNSTETYAVAFGYDNDANEVSTFVSGARAKAYLRGQRSHAPNRDLAVAGVGQAQMSELIAIRTDTLTTGATTTLSLDGTGTTNLIIPDGTNRVWNVTIKYTAVVTLITGTATGVSVGDCKNEVLTIGFKKIGGTSSVVGSLNTVSTNQDSSMSTASFGVTAGASQEMKLDFTAPTFLGGGSVTTRVVAKVELTECGY